jgi:hypothetical protein
MPQLVDYREYYTRAVCFQMKSVQVAPLWEQFVQGLDDKRFYKLAVSM